MAEFSIDYLSDFIYDWESRRHVPRYSRIGQILQAVDQASLNEAIYAHNLPNGWTYDPISRSQVRVTTPTGRILRSAWENW